MRFVCAGDCGVDRYGDRGFERPGGIGLNVAVHLRRLCAPGDAVIAVAPIGDDAGAGLVRDALARTGVESCLEVVPGATPVQHIRRGPGGERVFERYDEGVLAGYRVSPRQRDAIAACDVLATTAFGQGLSFFESVMGSRPQGLRAVDFTNANDVGDAVAFATRWAPELDVGLFGLSVADAALIDALEGVAAPRRPAVRGHARSRGRARARPRSPHRLPGAGRRPHRRHDGSRRRIHGGVPVRVRRRRRHRNQPRPRLRGRGTDARPPRLLRALLTVHARGQTPSVWSAYVGPDHGRADRPPGA